jgi:hypothetical protein
MPKTLDDQDMLARLRLDAGSRTFGELAQGKR